MEATPSSRGSWGSDGVQEGGRKVHKQTALGQSMGQLGPQSLGAAEPVTQSQVPLRITVRVLNGRGQKGEVGGSGGEFEVHSGRK